MIFFCITLIPEINRYHDTDNSNTILPIKITYDNYNYLNNFIVSEEWKYFIEYSFDDLRPWTLD